MEMNKRQFLKSTAALSPLTLLSGCDWETSEKKKASNSSYRRGQYGWRESKGYLIV